MEVSELSDSGPEFYHVKLAVPVLGVTNLVLVNQSRQSASVHMVCPFLLKETGMHGQAVFNYGFFASLMVFSTRRPITKEWPVKSGIRWGETPPSEEMIVETGNTALEKWLDTNAKDVTFEFFRDASLLIESGAYQETRKQASELTKGRETFMICPVGNAEVDHNYEFVVKPAIEKHQFRIVRADEIPHTGSISDVIEQQIRGSRFVVADLTDERQNCYYEVGLARAWRKPTILLAKEGTTRHFDISGVKWTMWTDYRDLKPKFERELTGVLERLGSL